MSAGKFPEKQVVRPVSQGNTKCIEQDIIDVKNTTSGNLLCHFKKCDKDKKYRQQLVQMIILWKEQTDESERKQQVDVSQDKKQGVLSRNGMCKILICRV